MNTCKLIKDVYLYHKYSHNVCIKQKLENKDLTEKFITKY